MVGKKADSRCGCAGKRARTKSDHGTFARLHGGDAGHLTGVTLLVNLLSLVKPKGQGRLELWYEGLAMVEGENSEIIPPSGTDGGKFVRGAMNAVGGAIPFLGGVFSAAAGFWSEAEQEKLNSFFQHWLEMLKAEAAEKQRTIIEITERLDIILSHAGATRIVSDDVVKLFMEWVKTYSEFHFQVVAKIYNHAGITRAGVWDALGREPVREDSADADLFRLLFHDLSTGRVIRQHRETDYAGNFIAKTPPSWRGMPRPVPGTRQMKSAFDDTESYELTQLGQQFIHYAMTDLPLKLNYAPADATAEAELPAAG